MANPSKAKGTKGETRVVNYLLSQGYKAQRRALSGSEDKGDIEYSYGNHGQVRILEVKTGKMTQNYSRSTRNEWLRQTEVEQHNAKMTAHLVVVRFGRAIEDAEVWSVDGQTFMYLDEFANHCK